MASVTILREGHFRWLKKGISCEASATSTLIRDGKFIAIVDAPNIGEKKPLLAALKHKGLAPADINHIFVTHYHPDHIGCFYLFPQAVFIDAFSRHQNGRFDFWQSERLALTSDVTIIKTPGHTPDGASALAKTEKGVVAAVGDLWWRERREETVLAWDKTALEVSRKKILKEADFIIPGHGGVFSVE